MSQSSASHHHPSENEDHMGTPEKSTMPIPGNRGVSSAQRNKTPSQLPRSTNQGDSVNNSAEDGSSSNKVQSTIRRSFAKSSGSPTSPKKPLPSVSTAPRKNERLETMYAMKKKRYQKIRQELIDKQKAAQELYNEMFQLREKVITSGAKDPGQLEDLKFTVGLPQPSSTTESSGYIDQSNNATEKLTNRSEFLESLELQLQEIPKKSQNLCRELLKKQSSFVAFVTSRLIKASDEEVETDNANLEMISQLQAHQKDYNSLQSCLHEVEVSETKAVADAIQYTRDVLTEYENHQAKQKELDAMEARKGLQEQLNTTLEELQAEREKFNQGKERLRQQQTQLQRAHTKIRELESHVANDDGKIQQLQGNIKNLEGQIKQKDQTTELRLKDMQKTMKNSEGLVAKVEKQRDSFETRLVELKEKMSSKESEALNTIKELSEKLKIVSFEATEEKEKKQRVEEALCELEERYKHLEEKSNQLCDLAEKNKDFTITEGSHSDNEVRLFNELQETRAELDMQKDMVTQLLQEKEEIVAVMHQAASHDEEENAKEKLAAELIIKTRELKDLMAQYTEIKKVAKNAQEKSGILERQLIEIQTRLHSQSKEGGKAGLSAHAIELQQQIFDLRNDLAKVIQQKEELETVLTQKQLELEQRDRVMREQNKFLKVRDELLDILKGKVQQQENGELSTSDENNELFEQIAAKTEAIQELHATLESKQMQIMRLEKMVKLMEDQQDRAQAQRTRLENRIADLQHELQKNKEQRYVGEKSSFTKFPSDSDHDKSSQDYFSDSDQTQLQYISDACSPSHQNQHDLITKKSDTLPDTITSQTDNQPSHTYKEYSSQQTSSDEERPYICNKCREELTYLKKDDESKSNRDDSDDSLHQSFHNRFATAPLEITKPLVNTYNYHDDDYSRDAPLSIRDSRCTITCNLYGESDKANESSRESQYTCQRESHRHRYPLRYHTRSAPINEALPQTWAYKHF